MKRPLCTSVIPPNWQENPLRKRPHPLETRTLLRSCVCVCVCRHESLKAYVFTLGNHSVLQSQTSPSPLPIDTVPWLLL